MLTSLTVHWPFFITFEKWQCDCSSCSFLPLFRCCCFFFHFFYFSSTFSFAISLARDLVVVYFGSIQLCYVVVLKPEKHNFRQWTWTQSITSLNTRDNVQRTTHLLAKSEFDIFNVYSFRHVNKKKNMLNSVYFFIYNMNTKKKICFVFCCCALAPCCYGKMCKNLKWIHKHTRYNRCWCFFFRVCWKSRATFDRVDALFFFLYIYKMKFLITFIEIIVTYEMCSAHNSFLHINWNKTKREKKNEKK